MSCLITTLFQSIAFLLAVSIAMGMIPRKPAELLRVKQLSIS